jgi:hypothetical protein
LNRGFSFKTAALVIRVGLVHFADVGFAPNSVRLPIWWMAHRYSIRKSLPSVKPTLVIPFRKAANTASESVAVRALRNPIECIAGCARTANGHTTAAPITVTNSRRLTR